MVFLALAQRIGMLLDLGRLPMRTDQSKDIEILLPRRQLAILRRTQARSLWPTRREQLILTMLVARLTRLCGGARARLDSCLLLFRPNTVLRWHRDLVRRKWTFRLQLVTSWEEAQAWGLAELAVGLALGTLRLPVVPVVIAIGVQALVVSLVGLRLGAALGARIGARATLIAGGVLCLLAVWVAVSNVVGR